MNFENIVGHEKIKCQISRSIADDKFSHAHIICGEDGIGKSLIAKNIAIKLLKKEEEKQYVDIVEFRIADNKKSIGIDEIRNLIEEINKKPYECDKKVVIVFNGEKITEAAQNAFLKTVEEPPKGVFILLLCDNLEKILPTIKSRCQIHNLQRLNENEIKKFIKIKYPNANEENINYAVIFSDGIPGRAEKFIKDEVLNETRDITANILMGISKCSIDELLKYEEKLSKYKANWQEMLTWFLAYVRDVIIYKETGNKDLLINLDKFDTIKYIAEMFSFNQLNGIINIIKETRVSLESNVNTSLVFSSMLMKLKEV